MKIIHNIWFKIIYSSIIFYLASAASTQELLLSLLVIPAAPIFVFCRRSIEKTKEPRKIFMLTSFALIVGMTFVFLPAIVSLAAKSSTSFGELVLKAVTIIIFGGLLAGVIEYWRAKKACLWSQKRGKTINDWFYKIALFSIRLICCDSSCNQKNLGWWLAITWERTPLNHK